MMIPEVVFAITLFAVGGGEGGGDGVFLIQHGTD